MDIERVQVILTDGADVVVLTTTHPSPVASSKSNLSLKFFVSRSMGRKYVIDNFNKIPEIINRRNQKDSIKQYLTIQNGSIP